jgi:flagellar biosynthesis regulator FlbT
MPGWLQLANDAFYLFGSAVIQSMEHHRTTKVRRLFFVSQSVSRANKANSVNMSAPLLKKASHLRSFAVVA